LEGKQEGGRKAKEKKETNRRSPKAGAKTDMAIISSMVEEANVSSAGNNRACSGGRSGKNERGNDEETRTEDRDVFWKASLYHGDG